MFDSGLSGVRAAVTEAARRCQPELLTLDTAVTALSEWTAIANAAGAACALLAARIDELGPPPAAGASDAAEFISKTTGTTAAKASQRIKTGKKMRRADATRERAVDGGLSPDQADAIADAVDADPEAEESLLDAAGRSSLGELRDECARRKAAADPDPDATHRRIHTARRLRRYRDAEGAEHLHATGTKEQLAIVDQALRPHIDAAFQAARRDGLREPYDAYALDALVAMASASLPSGTASPTDPTNSTAPARRAERYLGLLRIDLEALLRGAIHGEETCEIAGLGPVPVTTARDLLGESILKLVITRGVDVANITHLGRGPSTAQKIALLWQRPTCTREGCGRRGHLEIDHRDAWAHVHCTQLHNLDPLCLHDHRLKTTKGWALINGTGTRPMVPPTDPRHPRFHTTTSATGTDPRAGPQT